jgi:plasmid stabilization system protein ParE
MAEYQIKWTARAIKDLQKVYFFNIDLMGEEKSFAIIETLLSRVDFLADKRFVKIGPTDQQFSHLKRKYKKLIEGHIKITYRVSSDKTSVYINRVFDTRQNPRKNI